MVAVAGKNGYLYGLSRDLKNVFFQTPVTRVENTDAPLTARRNALPAGHAGRHQLVRPVILAAAQRPVRSRHRLGDHAQARRPGHPQARPAQAVHRFSQRIRRQDPKEQRFGHITAVDADSGQVLWKYDTDTPMVASVTPTAGGVLLTGDTKGNFLAFDAASGRVLLKKELGDPIGGGISTTCSAAPSTLPSPAE